MDEVKPFLQALRVYMQQVACGLRSSCFQMSLLISWQRSLGINSSVSSCPNSANILNCTQRCVSSGVTGRILWLLASTLSSCSGLGPGPAASTTSLDFLRPQPRLVNQKSWEWDSTMCVLKSLSGHSDAPQSLRTTAHISYVALGKTYVLLASDHQSLK